MIFASERFNYRSVAMREQDYAVNNSVQVEQLRG